MPNLKPFQPNATVDAYQPDDFSNPGAFSDGELQAIYEMAVGQRSARIEAMVSDPEFFKTSSDHPDEDAAWYFEEIADAALAALGDSARDPMTTLKPFTASDWSAWAGAEPFSDGHEPLIGYVGRATFIADGAGIGLFYGDQEWAPITALNAKGSKPDHPVEARAMAQEIFAALTGGEGS